MDSADKGRSCLKVGCLGCVGCLTLPVLLVLVLALASFVGRREPRPESVHRSQDVTTPPGSVAPPSTEKRPAAAQIGEPGRIVLDVSRCLFELIPGPSGSSLEVEGRYDTAAFELTEEYERYGETGWIYRLSLEPRGFLRFGGDGGSNRLQLIVPRDMPFVLEGKIGIGESRLELGGLWLMQADLDLGIGEHELSFKEPLPAPMEHFGLDGSIGELRVLHLGNASPSTVLVEHNIGEVLLDLSGDWKRDAHVEARCGIGECSLKVPEEVAVVVEESTLRIGEQNLSRFEDEGQPAPGSPTLRLAVSGFIGELRVDR